ncbi:DoxX family protein [Stratiformator vulcanicus]|uniref:DoxX n=1 Tax=Stratiformator vulcanicus TaxID=2527980 RepID=A0A517R1I8_9PLAN|nr:DoxX family protein [Stratiformator vulcanicus]QDT37736.1 hypothetical protein Pan189_21180 [Stratiformator vulcanicus]
MSDPANAVETKKGSSKPSKAASIVGWVLTVLPALMLFASAGFKLSMAEDVRKSFTEFGYPESAIIPIGITELICTVLFLIPQTAILGAILLTGYMGGAIATHVQAGDPFYVQAAIGVVLWIALYLREPRLRSIAPWRG